MTNFSISGTFTNVPDPNFQYFARENNAFIGGKPIRQGYPSGQLTFPALNSAMFHELYARWSAHSTAQSSGALPRVSGYGWKPVSAWWHEPLPTGWDGGFAHGVQMRVTQIVNI